MQSTTAPKKTAGLLLAAILLATTGCSLRNDPHYNRFCPTGGRPGATQRTDKLVTSAEHALDNGRQRLDNFID
jgi:hypothetical protein